MIKNLEYFLIGLVAVVVVFIFMPVLLLLETIQSHSPMVDKISSFFF